MLDSGFWPQWGAAVNVHARELALLSNFSLDELKPENLRVVYAYNPEGKMVYLWNAKDDSVSFNTMSGKAMKGWWPSEKV